MDKESVVYIHKGRKLGCLENDHWDNHTPGIKPEKQKRPYFPSSMNPRFYIETLNHVCLQDTKVKLSRGTKKTRGGIKGKMEGWRMEGELLNTQYTYVCVHMYI